MRRPSIRPVLALSLSLALPVQAWVQVRSLAPAALPEAPLAGPPADVWPALEAWLSARLDIPEDPGSIGPWKQETASLLRSEPSLPLESAVARAFAQARRLHPDQAGLCSRALSARFHFDRVEPNASRLLVLGNKLFESRPDGYFERPSGASDPVDHPSVIAGLDRLGTDDAGFPRLLRRRPNAVLSSVGRLYDLDEKGKLSSIAPFFDVANAASVEPEAALVKPHGTRGLDRLGGTELHYLPNGLWRFAPPAPPDWRASVLASFGSQAPARAAVLEQGADGSILARGRAIFSKLASTLGSRGLGFGPGPKAKAPEPVSSVLAKRIARVLDFPPQGIRLEAFKKKAAEIIRSSPEASTADSALVAFAAVHGASHARLREAHQEQSGIFEPSATDLSAWGRRRMIDGRLYAAEPNGLWLRNGSSSVQLLKGLARDVGKADGRLFAARDDGIWEYQGPAGTHPSAESQWTRVSERSVAGFQEFDGRLLAHDGYRPLIWANGRWRRWRQPFWFRPFARRSSSEIDSIVRVGDNVYGFFHGRLYRRFLFFWWRYVPGFPYFAHDVVELGGSMVVRASNGVWIFAPDRAPARLRADAVASIAAAGGVLYALPKEDSPIERWDGGGRWTSVRGPVVNKLQSAGDSLWVRTHTNKDALWRPPSPLATQEEWDAFLQELESAQPPPEPARDPRPAVDAWTAIASWFRSVLGALEPEAWKREAARLFRSQPDLPFEKGLALAAAKARAPEPTSIERVEDWLDHPELRTIVDGRPQSWEVGPTLEFEGKLYVPGGSSHVRVFDGERWVTLPERFNWLGQLDGQLYACLSSGGVYLRKGGHWQPFDGFGTFSTAVHSLLRFDGRVYAAAFDRVVEFAGERTIQRLNGKTVFELKVVDGKLLAATDEGIFELDRWGERPWGAKAGRTFFVRRVGLRTYIGTDKGLFGWRDDRWVAEQVEAQPSPVHDVLELDGKLYALMDSGVYVKEAKAWRKVLLPERPAVELVKFKDKVFVRTGSVFYEWLPKPADIPDAWKPDMLTELGKEMERQTAQPEAQRSSPIESDEESVLKGGRSIFSKP